MRTMIYHGKKIDLAVERTSLPDGTTLEREVVLHPGAVVILPLLDDGRVCLVRNYRHTIGSDLLELPAGTLEPPEPPETAAQRELAEETGFRAARWKLLAEFYPSPGIMTEKMYLFVARALTPGASDLQAGEQMDPVIVPWSQALTWAVDGTIQDAKTLVGILLWDKTLVDQRN